jgi:putative acetyltransferase
MPFVYKYFTEVPDDFIILSNELDKEFTEKNGEKQKIYNQYNKLDAIKDIIIVYDKEKAIGCGSIKQYDETTYEVKRMYVQKEYRGKGISKEIIRKLEEEAKKKGIISLILETSKIFNEAVSLYKGMGYSVIENYGQYEGLELSICMGKEL